MKMIHLYDIKRVALPLRNFLIRNNIPFTDIPKGKKGSGEQFAVTNCSLQMDDLSGSVKLKHQNNFIDLPDFAETYVNVLTTKALVIKHKLQPKIKTATQKGLRQIGHSKQK